MYNFTFVVLHYQSFENTKICIDSILCINYDNIDIIIVDNASTNDSLTKLKQEYQIQKNIHFIASKSNLGFANGNNLGYTFAKEELKADFIIIANNDIEIISKNVIELMVKSYNEYGYYVLGPKVIYNGEAPYMFHYEFNIESIKKDLSYSRKKYVFYKLHLEGIFSVLRKIKKLIFPKRNNKQTKLDPESIHTNIMLDGSFYVFSPNYVGKFQTALNPKVYFYCDENLLYLRLRKDNLLSLYYPEIVINHRHEAYTISSPDRNRKKELFHLKHICHSYEVVIDELEKMKI